MMSLRRVAIALLLSIAFACIAARAQSTPAANPAHAPQIDRIVILKSARTLNLMSGGKVVKSYKVALGAAPTGAKQQQGDHKTPEGIYAVQAKIPSSQFHRALLISYPNAADRERARKMGVKPGGSVEIHGIGAKYGWLGAAHREYDWTDGCVAVTNEEIDEIYPLVAVGTLIEIRP
jgi:murein L,D-transpeptidase YafK